MGETLVIFFAGNVQWEGGTLAFFFQPYLWLYLVLIQYRLNIYLVFLQCLFRIYLALRKVKKVMKSSDFFSVFKGFEWHKPMVLSENILCLIVFCYIFLPFQLFLRSKNGHVGDLGASWGPWATLNRPREVPPPLWSVTCTKNAKNSFVENSGTLIWTHFEPIGGQWELWEGFVWL